MHERLQTWVTRSQLARCDGRTREQNRCVACWAKGGVMLVRGRGTARDLGVERPEAARVADVSKRTVKAEVWRTTAAVMVRGERRSGGEASSNRESEASEGLPGARAPRMT